MTAPFEINREVEPSVLILRPAGYINESGGSQIRVACEEALAENLRAIIIDFHSSDQINSLGISNLIAVIEKSAELGARLAFTGLSQSVREVFDLVGITRHVLVADDADQVRQQFGAAEDTPMPDSPKPITLSL